jgi:hypothetical protein
MSRIYKTYTSFRAKIGKELEFIQKAKNDTATKDGHLNAPIAITYANAKKDQVRLDKEAAKRKEQEQQRQQYNHNQQQLQWKAPPAQQQPRPGLVAELNVGGGQNAAPAAAGTVPPPPPAPVHSSQQQQPYNGQDGEKGQQSWGGKNGGKGGGKGGKKGKDGKSKGKGNQPCFSILNNGSCKARLPLQPR